MRVSILGVGIDNISHSQARERVRQYLLSGDKDYIVTPNPEFLIKAKEDPSFRGILNRASLAIPDGVGLVWASRFLGRPLVERVTGADLAEDAVSLAAELGKSVFFLGGKNGAGAKAAEVMSRKYPGLRVAGMWEGSGDAGGDEAARNAIGLERIGLLLIAFGQVKQEAWIERNRSKLKFNLAIGVGGTFDYWSGRVGRAPVVIRSLGLEWLYRLIREPWRWRRQLALIEFAWLVLKVKPRGRSAEETQVSSE